MDDFGRIPNAPDFARYMAKRRSDSTWCVWDYRMGMAVASRDGKSPEALCRSIANSMNRAERARELGMVER